MKYNFIFLVSHSEISGKVFKELQPENIKLISITFLVFHLEISGKLFNKQQPENI